MSVEQQLMVEHETKPMVEAMLLWQPNLACPLQALGVISQQDGRLFSGSDHPELEPLLGSLKSEHLKIVAVYGNLQTVALVNCNPEMKSARLHPVWYITGHTSRVEKHSWTRIAAELMDGLSHEDFLPEPFCKRAVLIDSWTMDKLHGVCFSECWSGMWTVGSPFDLPAKNMLKSSYRDIVQLLVDHMREK